MNRNFSNYYIILLYCVFNIIIKINGDFKIRIYYNILDLFRKFKNWLNL